MEQTAFKLPIRLLPRKGSQLFLLLFFTFFTGFAIFWIGVASSFTWFAENGPNKQMWFFNFFPLFGLLFVIVGAAGLLHTIAKLLPGSPYHHLAISAEGLLVRTLRRKQHVAWGQLSPFDVSVREHRDNDGDRSYTHYVVALAAADASKLADEHERYNRAVVRIDADEFGAENAATDAADMATWFNRLRELALDSRLPPHDEVSVPLGFRASVWSGAASPHDARLPRPERPQSVIQR